MKLKIIEILFYKKYKTLHENYVKFLMFIDTILIHCYTKNRKQKESDTCMNIKILVEVYVKELNKTYNVFVPTNKTIHEIAGIISNSITEQSKGVYQVTNHSTIYDKENRNIENTTLTIEKLSLLNGLKLTLV